MHNQQLGEVSDQLHELLYAGDQGLKSYWLVPGSCLPKWVARRHDCQWIKAMDEASSR